MIDRDLAMKAGAQAINRWLSNATGEDYNDLCDQVVDAILALPDPVHEAARRLLDVAAVVGAGPSEFAALRAALAAEPVPTPDRAVVGGPREGVSLLETVVGYLLREIALDTSPNEVLEGVRTHAYHVTRYADRPKTEAIANGEAARDLARELMGKLPVTR